jgi:hypothetical protein
MNPSVVLKPLSTGGAKKMYTAWPAIHVDTLADVAQAAVRRNQKRLDADGNHFQHLL